METECAMPQQPQTPPRRSIPGRIGQGLVKVLTFFVILEPIWMLLPFAGFLYGSGLRIQMLARHSQTAWLTHFVLPVLTLGPTGPILVVVGFGIFLIGAGQIYWAKFRRTGMVKRGLYTWVRHPQYTALTLFGVGLLLAWGRAIMFLAFFLMMFLYYYLAKSEERKCVALFGEEYETYRKRMSFCIPGDRFVASLWAKLPRVPMPRPLRPVVSFALTAGLALGLLWMIGTIRTRIRTVPFMTTTVSFGPPAAWEASGPDLFEGRVAGVPFVMAPDKRLVVIRGPWRNSCAPGFAETVLRRALDSPLVEFIEDPSADAVIVFCTPYTPPTGDVKPGKQYIPKDSLRRGPEPDPDGPDRVRLLLMGCKLADGATITDALADKSKRSIRAFCVARIDLSRAADGNIVDGEPAEAGKGFDAKQAENRWDHVINQLAEREALSPKPKNIPTRPLPRPGTSTELILVQAPILRTRIQPEGWFGARRDPDEAPPKSQHENHFARDILDTLAASPSFQKRIKRFGAGGDFVPVIFPRPGPNWYRQHHVRYHPTADGGWERRGATPQVSVFVMLVRRMPGMRDVDLFDESQRDKREIRGAFIAELDFGIKPPTDPVGEIVIIGPRRDLEERWDFFLSGL